MQYSFFFQNGLNYVHVAVKSGDPVCVSTLVDHIVDHIEEGRILLRVLLSTPDHEGETPLMAAVSLQDTSILQILINVGIDLRAIAIHQPCVLKAASKSALEVLSTNGKSCIYYFDSNIECL